MERRHLIRLLIVIGLGTTSACTSTMAEVPLFDGNFLVVSGHGTKSSVAQKCLSAETIKQLMSSDIPDTVPKATCYWVQIISTDSSDISKAVAQFISADTEFKQKIANLAAPKAAPVAVAAPVVGGVEKPSAGEVATQVLAAAVIKEPDKVVAEVANIPAAQRADVKVELQKIRNRVVEPRLQKTLDLVLLDK